MENTKNTISSAALIKAEIYDLMVAAEQHKIAINDIQSEINKLSQKLHENLKSNLQEIE